jgi:hypothetical protein
MALKYFAFQQEGKELQKLTIHPLATGRMRKTGLAAEFYLDARSIKLDGMQYASGQRSRIAYLRDWRTERCALCRPFKSQQACSLPLDGMSQICTDERRYVSSSARC